MPHPHILHMITPLKHMSPFDVNMALDAGFDAVVPYTQVTLEEVRGLVQDAIFSRSPTDAARTGLFIAGKSASLALDMAKAAADAMVGPFRLSVFADPAGSFTTAAALVAVVERELAGRGRALKDVAVAVFGATGVVGYSAGVIAALEGARVTLVGYDGAARVAAAAAEMKARFGIEVAAADGSTAEKKAAAPASTSPSRRPPPASRCSRRPSSRRPATSSSPPTSTPCRPPASRASPSTPAASRSPAPASPASARSPSAT